MSSEIYEMNDEVKKSAEDLESNAEAKKDAGGQYRHCARTNNCGYLNMVVYDVKCTRYGDFACGVTRAI